MFFLDKRVLLLCTFGRLGREKKKARGGRWEGEEIKRGTEAPVLSSSHHPPHAYLFLLLFFIWIPAMAYLNKRGTSECFAPGVPSDKREKDAFRKAFNVCMAG